MFHLQVQTATASGSTIKSVVCEKCAYTYPYILTRSIKISDITPMGIGAATSQGIATAAEDRLAKVFETDCDPVPCPQCGWYQSAMLGRAQGVLGRKFRTDLKTIGVALLISSAIALQGAIFLVFEGLEQNESLMILAGVALIAFGVPGLIAGIGVIRRRNRLLREYNPNADLPDDERKNEGRRREQEARNELEGTNQGPEWQSNFQQFHN